MRREEKEWGIKKDLAPVGRTIVLFHQQCHSKSTMSQEKVSARLLTIVLFITGILVFLALPFLPGRPKQHVVRPVKISFLAGELNEPNEPNERYLVAL
jgi:hypothetical protein